MLGCCGVLHPTRETAFALIQAFLNTSDKPETEDAAMPFSKRRKLSESILEEEEMQREMNISHAREEIEDEGEASEEEEEDRQSRRRRAIRQMILNTPSFVPYFRPEILAAYQPPPLYHRPPPSMFM